MSVLNSRAASTIVVKAAISLHCGQKAEERSVEKETAGRAMLSGSSNRIAFGSLVDELGPSIFHFGIDGRCDLAHQCMKVKFFGRDSKDVRRPGIRTEPKCALGEIRKVIGGCFRTRGRVLLDCVKYGLIQC